MMVPATERMSLRVRKKNRIPVNAIVSFTTCSQNRRTSVFHELDGTARRISIGFFDSSWISDEYNDRANVRDIKNIYSIKVNLKNYFTYLFY